MPWCEPCARFYNPNTLDAEGDCPDGHHVVDPGKPDGDIPKVPWHFWLMLAALALYLGWRLIQGVAWLFT